MPRKSKEEREEKLEELIQILEQRLSIFDENKFKEICKQHLISMNKTIQQLEGEHIKLYELLGISWNEIHNSE